MIYIPILSFLIVTVLVPPLMHYAVHLGFIDKPGARKIHAKEIPRVGGIAMVIGTIIPVGLLLPSRADLILLEAGISILFLFGLLDDRLNLSYKIKFFGQILSAIVVVVFGDIAVRHLPFINVWALPDVIAYPLTIFIIVGVTNAINLSDGLDGLAGGLGALILCFLSFLAYEKGDTLALIFSLSVLAATLGFLRYNTNPALVFMGDSGSQFLGFSTATLAIIITQSPDSAVSVLTPAILFLIPVLDTLIVMASRIWSGRSPFAADQTHFHHRLLRLGLSHHETVLVAYLFQFLMMLAAYFSRYTPDSFVILLIAIATLFFIISSFSRLPSRKNLEGFLEGSRWNLPGFLRIDFSFLGKTIPTLLLLGVMSILILGSLLVSDVSIDIGLFSVFALIFLLGCMKVKDRCSGFERVSVYYSLAAILLLLSRDHYEPLYLTISLVLCVFFSLALALSLQFTPRPFRVTSLDYLLLAIVVWLLIFSGKWPDIDGYLFLQMFIVFYVVDFIQSNFSYLYGLLCWGGAISLFVLVMKASLLA